MLFNECGECHPIPHGTLFRFFLRLLLSKFIYAVARIHIVTVERRWQLPYDSIDGRLIRGGAADAMRANTKRNTSMLQGLCDML